VKEIARHAFGIEKGASEVYKELTKADIKTNFQVCSVHANVSKFIMKHTPQIIDA
jgi:hypothetical protein